MTSRLIQEHDGEGCNSRWASSRLPDMNRQGSESRLRDFIWGLLILLMGMFAIFGYWFLLVG